MLLLLNFSILFFSIVALYTVRKSCADYVTPLQRHMSTGGGGGVITDHHKSNTRHINVALAEGGEALVSDQRGEYHTWIQLTTITTLGTSHHTLYLAYILLFFFYFLSHFFHFFV